MKYEIGQQYEEDGLFKASARLHQSKYRANVLLVDYDEYGNRLTEPDARNLLNYYPGLNVRSALRTRYPSYSKMRDADMLRSEHIPFNLFAPLVADSSLAKHLVENAFSVPCKSIEEVLFEYAPEPKENYLNDRTAFDVYIRYLNKKGEPSGIGVEVKYTEKEYRIGITEKEHVEDKESKYWQVTRSSGIFINASNEALATDSLRQIWRNHLLGLSLVQKGVVKEFVSITLYPQGNTHFQRSIPQYQDLLGDNYHRLVRGCSYEHYVDKINGNNNMLHWKDYLTQRYLINST